MNISHESFDLRLGPIRTVSAVRSVTAGRHRYFSVCSLQFGAGRKADRTEQVTGAEQSRNGVSLPSTQITTGSHPSQPARRTPTSPATCIMLLTERVAGSDPACRSHKHLKIDRFCDEPVALDCLRGQPDASLASEAQKTLGVSGLSPVFGGALHYSLPFSCPWRASTLDDRPLMVTTSAVLIREAAAGHPVLDRTPPAFPAAPAATLCGGRIG